MKTANSEHKVNDDSLILNPMKKKKPDGDKEPRRGEIEKTLRAK